MEILQLLINFLTNGAGEKYKGLLDLFVKDSFDIKRVLKDITPDKIAPIIKEFLSDKKSPAAYAGESVGLNPIANVADKDIVYTLNKYFYG